MKRVLTPVFLLVIVFSLSAIDEDKLDTAYYSEIKPFIEAETSEGQIQMADGAVLAYRCMLKSETQVIMILLGGHTESYIKYAEFFYDLRDLDMSIYALDQRGQGFSSRMLPDPEKDHVADYNSFIDDLNSFITEVVKPGDDDAILLLGHSFGAAVAAAYAERYPSTVAGLILSSPYISSKAGPLAMGFIGIIDFFGGAEKYVPGGGPFAAVDFAANKETHSRARHERKMKDYAEYPAIRLGHPTNHWMLELEKLGREARKNADKISCPTLVFQAEYDEYTNRRTQDQFIAKVSDCRSIMLNEAYHEILIETDAIRNTVLKEIRDFIRRYL